MKKINYLKLLTENIYDLPATYNLETIYKKACAYKAQSYDDFLIDFSKYLRLKPIKKFILNENEKTLIVENFGEYSIDEMFKYFKIGKNVFSLDIHILYKSWNQQNKTLEDFEKELRNVMATRGRGDTYFIFDSQVTFQKSN